MRLQILLSIQAAALPTTKELEEKWIPLTAIMPKSRINRGKGIIFVVKNKRVSKALFSSSEIEKLALMIDYLLADDMKLKFE